MIFLVCVARLVYFSAVAIRSLSQESVSESFIKPGGLESNSSLENSLIAATTLERDNVAFVLKYLPAMVRSIHVHSIVGQ